MRHESIDTTMKYYLGQNAQNTAKTLRAAYQLATRGTGHDDYHVPRAEEGERRVQVMRVATNETARIG